MFLIRTGESLICRCGIYSACGPHHVDKTALSSCSVSDDTPTIWVPRGLVLILLYHKLGKGGCSAPPPAVTITILCNHPRTRGCRHILCLLLGLQNGEVVHLGFALSVATQILCRLVTHILDRLLSLFVRVLSWRGWWRHAKNKKRMCKFVEQGDAGEMRAWVTRLCTIGLDGHPWLQSAPRVPAGLGNKRTQGGEQRGGMRFTLAHSKTRRRP